MSFLRNSRLLLNLIARQVMNGPGFESETLKHLTHLHVELLEFLRLIVESALLFLQTTLLQF